MFGRLNEDGLRQYRTVYVEIPRKNGKSTLAAAIALYLLMADGEQGGEVYGAAVDCDQASIVFNTAAEMVNRTPGLDKLLRVIPSTKRILHAGSGSFYRAIPGDAAGSWGFNASGIIFDELHVQKNRELWDALTTSTASREQPLIFAITTAGYDRNSICWEVHDYALKVQEGIIDDPTFLPVVYAADETEDWTDEEVWRRANPSLGETFTIDYLREEFKRAKQVPAFQNTFRRLYLNQWTQQSERWLDIAAWDKCSGFPELVELEGQVCYGGLDLASTTDIAAFVLVFPVGEMFAVLPHFFVPSENIEERERRDRVPYREWVRQGLITATPGNVIDYRSIDLKIRELGAIHNIKEIAFDRWGATEIIQNLDDAGFTVVQFGQGFASMSPPTKELLNLVLSEKLMHGGNKVLRWMADNMVVRTDPAGNIKPDKSKSTERIDGLVATIMGLDRAVRREKKSKYEREGLLVI